MLTKERQAEIVKLVNQNGAVTVADLAELFATSPSTIRRDLNYLAEQKLLDKVFGGATMCSDAAIKEENMETKLKKNLDNKVKLAQYAATLIEPGDLVYVDAGTTTEQLAAFIKEKQATYVTNNIPFSLQLAKKGFKVRLLGGQLKATTEAVIGAEARMALQRLNFNIGFFGANGVTAKEGFTTPDMEEADGKSVAIQHCKAPYVLVDESKLGLITGVRFAPIGAASIITTKLVDRELANLTEVVEVDAQ